MHKKWPIRMSVVTIVAALLLTYRWDIYVAVRDLYRTEIKGIKSPRVRSMAEQEKIKHIFDYHNDKLFGIDVSHYQKTIDWNEVGLVGDSVKLSFAICRATMGTVKQDTHFKRNWKAIKEKNMVRGAYHYYRPNENSLKQAASFIKHVKIGSGDLPPILDIEALPEIQTIAELKLGLKRWLNKVEEHYGVKPIIYTGDYYFRNYLDNATFREYPIWIANYSRSEKPRLNKWIMWQFSESGIVPGIGTRVDLNVLNGSEQSLQELLMP